MTNALYFTRKALFILEIFKLLYFPCPLFFPLSSIAEFIEEVDEDKS